jgi:hypothetical protein
VNGRRVAWVPTIYNGEPRASGPSPTPSGSCARSHARATGSPAPPRARRPPRRRRSRRSAHTCRCGVAAGRLGGAGLARLRAAADAARARQPPVRGDQPPRRRPGLALPRVDPHMRNYALITLAAFAGAAGDAHGGSASPSAPAWRSSRGRVLQPRHAGRAPVGQPAAPGGGPGAGGMARRRARVGAARVLPERAPRRDVGDGRRLGGRRPLAALGARALPRRHRRHADPVRRALPLRRGGRRGIGVVAGFFVVGAVRAVGWLPAGATPGRLWRPAAVAGVPAALPAPTSGAAAADRHRIRR